MQYNKMRFLFVAAVLTSSACASGDLFAPVPQDSNGEYSPQGNNPNSLPVAQPVTVPPSTTSSAAQYVYIGRFDTTNPNAPMFGLPGSRIGATFSGTSVSATFTSTGLNFFNVTIDGGAPTIVSVNPNNVKERIPLATGLSDTEHTVWISKRTEYLQGSTSNVQFFGFSIDANASFGAPPAHNTRRIEFSGDSGFTGFGVDQLMTGPANYCSFTEATENADKSIPAFTGQLLNADIVNNSASGQAVYASVYDSNPNHLLPFMWNETTPPYAAPTYSFKTWTPDVVVVDAGGDDLVNDDSDGGNFPDPNAFVSAYEAWLANVRRDYPNAAIVVVLTPAAAQKDIATLGGALQQIVANRVSAGDANVFYFSYFTNDPSYTTYDDLAAKLGVGYGCSYHPSAAGAQWLAQRLATFIQTKMGW